MGQLFDRPNNPNKHLPPIRKTARRTYFKGIVNFHEDEVVINDNFAGKQICIEYPESVLIVPFVDDETVLILRQYRYVLSNWNYEFPGGIVDRGESPVAAAARELKEETGLVADTLEQVLEVHPDPSLTTQKVHVFIATASNSVKVSHDQSELIEPRLVHLKELSNLVRNRQIVDGGTIIGALFALNYRNRNVVPLDA